MSHFPNKMITEAYDAVDGKVLTKSIVNRKFTDQNGCSDYNYNAVQWLIDNNWIVELPYNPPKCFALQWKRRDQL